ncbi:VCBS repeat-containing protein [Pontibacter sp. G13]|uniref:FG-GAP repeat domain-containing protein n=1 Tax=Pontibacter sp. G13 TaxID=3074898 RepID=UPI00288A8A7F|nr:VCBS repeat-containing protein [Pontibacter sp. G13]WNJ20221.1 VCBS repeat-containing protein [Pontibacter sp. G13]
MNRIVWMMIGLAWSSSLFAQGCARTYTHIPVDSSRSKWGDFADPFWLKYFGMVVSDANGDGLLDICSGRTLYLNPADDLSSTWHKVDLGLAVDVIASMDVDGDEFPDLIAQALPNLYWLEAQDPASTQWKAQRIAQIPRTSHRNSQGFLAVDLIAGGREEFLIASGGQLHLIQIPTNPAKHTWRVQVLADSIMDEGLAVGDLNGDGRIDICTSQTAPKGQETTQILWMEQPAQPDQDWRTHPLGQTNHAVDRLAIGDLNGDGKLDIVATEERWPGKEPDANVFWFEQVDSLQWERHWIATQYSTNNLDLADEDQDGDLDLLTAEHKGPNLELQLWRNDGSGQFSKEVLDTGKEQHLGSQWHDLDADGDLDIVGIGWDQYEFLHVWRNERHSTDFPAWERISTDDEALALPNSGTQQTAALTVDLNGDGAEDFLIAERTEAPALTAYLFDGNGWIRHVADSGKLNIEAGATHADIDGDGDQDVVFGGSSKSNQLWWWENPFPNFDPTHPWKRHAIKQDGAPKHHDQLFGDFDGDGQQELVFWNQGARSLMLAEIPNDPRSADGWDIRPIYTYTGDSEMQPALGLGGYPGWSGVNEHEGLTSIDMDGDGILDIVGGGRWYRFDGEQFQAHIIDASYVFSRSIVGQFIEGNRPEVILCVGDGKGPLYLYEWIEWEGWKGSKRGTGTWKRTLLVEEIDNGHTLQALDFNGDGHLDFFTAEMRLGGKNPDARMRIFLGDGQGGFIAREIATGFGVHEGQMADLDGDGDWDILGKPYNWATPQLNLWINQTLQPR